MASVEYYIYLASDDWRKRRRKALSLSGNKCQICRNQITLQVHHKMYDRLGNEDDNDLAVLCEECHKSVHGEPYLTFVLCCKVCGDPGVEISSPDDGWIRFTCLDNHITERRL